MFLGQNFYYHGGLQIKALFGDDLKIFPIQSQNIPTITIFGTHQQFCPNFFFDKRMAQNYPTYLQFGHFMSKISFFVWTLSLKAKRYMIYE